MSSEKASGRYSDMRPEAFPRTFSEAHLGSHIRPRERHNPPPPVLGTKVDSAQNATRYGRTWKPTQEEIRAEVEAEQARREAFFTDYAPLVAAVPWGEGKDEPMPRAAAKLANGARAARWHVRVTLSIGWEMGGDGLAAATPIWERQEDEATGEIHRRKVGETENPPRLCLVVRALRHATAAQLRDRVHTDDTGQRVSNYVIGWWIGGDMTGGTWTGATSQGGWYGHGGGGHYGTATDVARAAAAAFAVA